MAHNGKEGLDKAHEEFPDIIVSDIMMPEMTGIELCETIKSDFNLCHIPIVLLTALASTQQNIEGLTKGADDYITKPFNTSILLVRCNNLVHNRLMLQKKFQQQGYTDTEVIANNPIDQHFLDALNSVIENHIDDTEFNIDHLACALGLSRSSLYAKFKSLTGITPNDYILSKKNQTCSTSASVHSTSNYRNIRYARIWLISLFHPLLQKKFWNCTIRI